MKKNLKQLKGTAIGTKFATPYVIMFMALSLKKGF